jgi:hypothetical protein
LADKVNTFGRIIEPPFSVALEFNLLLFINMVCFIERKWLGILFFCAFLISLHSIDIKKSRGVQIAGFVVVALATGVPSIIILFGKRKWEKEFTDSDWIFEGVNFQ